MPASIATKSSENCPIATVRAAATNQRQATRGRPTKSRAGNAASPKRSALNTIGGRSSRPRRIATKFTPQIAATATASRMSRGLMP